MVLAKLVFAAALSAASALAADPLAEMAGSWRGTGWARQTPTGPQETLRCQIRNSYEAGTLTLTLAGQCIVPGRRLKIAGALTGTDGAERITGRWSNPDGGGSVRITGLQRGPIVAFTFTAKDPQTGRNLAQNVEWRLIDGTLRLRSTDRDDPTIMMSDVSFEKR